MSVYFVYRTHYNSPTLTHVKKFDSASTLDWFKEHWNLAANGDTSKSLKELLGCDVYGFNTIFDKAKELKLAPPKSSAELEQLLNEHLYVEGEILMEPHLVQVLTNDDELEMAYFFFDDKYIAEYKHRPPFLLSKWELPTKFGPNEFNPDEMSGPLKPDGELEGNTYFSFLSYYDSGNLSNIVGSYRIDGVRLPQLARYLINTVVPEEKAFSGGNWPFELLLLRSQILEAPANAGPEEKTSLVGLRHNPQDKTIWTAFSKWITKEHKNTINRVLLERALRKCATFPIVAITNQGSTKGFGNSKIANAADELDAILSKIEAKGEVWPDATKVQIDEHIAQVTIKTDERDGVSLYQRWIIFDDLWAGSNVDLANSILRFANRWDVLSSED